jgi:hypothetical protein
VPKDFQSGMDRTEIQRNLDDLGRRLFGRP